MAKDVKVKFTGKPDELIRAQGKVIAKQAQMLKGQEKIARASQKVGKQVKGTTGQLDKMGTTGVASAKAIAGALGLTGGVLGLLRLITGELQKQKELREEAARTQITVSGARQALIRNLAGESAETIKATIASGEKIAADVKVPEQFIQQALASAVSASGGDIPAAISATRFSAKFLQEAPSQIDPFAGALLDLANVTGTKDAEVNAGLLIAVGKLSRVKDPAQQAKNIAPSLIGQSAFGSTVQGSAALFAALSTGAGDVEGAMSGTASIALAQQLRDFLPEGGTTTERIRTLQADPEQARAFLEGSSIERKLQGPIERLLTDVTSKVAQQFTENLAAIPDQAGLAELARQTIRNRELDPLEANAALERGLASDIQQAELKNIEGGGGAIAREKSLKLLETTGAGLVERTIAKLAFKGSDIGIAGDTETQIAVNVLKIRRKTLQAQGGPEAEQNIPILTAAIDRLVARVDANTESNDKGTDSTDKNTAETARNTTAGGGGAPGPEILDTQGEG